MEQLSLRIDSYIGTRVFNAQEIVNLKIKKINIPDEKFKTEDLEKIFDKIGTKREKFLVDINKKTEEKKIEYGHQLDDVNKKLYDEIEEEEERDLELSNNNIKNILIDRAEKGKKKKDRKK